MLLVNPDDRVAYRIYVAGPGTVAGDPGLPLPETHPGADSWVIYDTAVGATALRAVALNSSAGGRSTLVVVASTLKARDKLVREAVLGLLVPELAMILAALAVIWFGTQAGLAPLGALTDELARRSAADLRPLSARGPEEIQPVVDEINRLLARLDKSLASQRHFVSDAAHQLRTPIAALQAQVEATLRESDGQTRPRLERVLSPALRLSHLVDQLLALARAEPSSAQAAEPVELPEIARNAAERWLPAAIGKKIDLGFELAPAVVPGNRLLLSEMLANLIDNALRHTPEDGTITVSCGSTEEGAWLAVEDSGPGIAPEEREKVFARFYQAPGSRSDGCGLGLAIVAEIARQHGGTVAVDDSPGLGGTRLRIRLPACGG